ncbi:retrovirus-related pol polyprotein from transposon RE1 [Citrus sinensis]|nr:retrovirus-related pol polyprotein from transposon RE1 [Citrus sinensis]
MEILLNNFDGDGERTETYAKYQNWVHGELVPSPPLPIAIPNDEAALRLPTCCASCEEPAFDPKALLACHLSNHFQRAADEEGEVYPMSWQNCYDDQNLNQPENVDDQNPNNNTRNMTLVNASPTQHITSNTYVFTNPIKLTQNNFMLWKSQVISSIRANELEGFINGSHICPPRCFTNPGPNQTTITTTNPEYQIWKKQDHILLSWLLSSLSEGVLGTVVDCSTSCEVWTTLANQYGARTRARVLYLRTQIQTTKKGSLTIHDYYSRMKTILNTLRAAGNNMTDEDFIMCVLAGVGPEYDSVVTNINSMPETPSLSEVYGMLLSQETRTEQNLSTGSLEANFTQMRNGRRNWGYGERFGNQQQPGIVFRTPGSSSGNGGSGGPGQTNQNAQDKGKGKAVAENEGSESKGPCQICFKMGHTAAECWHRFKKNYVPQPNRRRGAYMASAEGQSSNAWYLDSGATNHVTNAIGNMNLNSEYQGNDKLTVGNGNKLHISHIGYSMLPTYNPHKHIKLNHILCVPDIAKNLISVSKLLLDNDINVEFHKSVCFIKDKSQGKILVKGVARDGLYELLCMPTHLSGNKVTYAAELSSFSESESISYISNPMSMMCFNFSVGSNESVSTSIAESSEADKASSRNLRTNDMDLWHYRLGHPNLSVLRNTLLSCNQLNINKNIFPSFCNACQYGKQAKQSFKSIETKTSTALELVHSDLWGPAPIPSTHGHKYYISFVDDRTRYTWLFPITAKSQALDTFIVFKNQIENQLNLKIKALQTDMGGEFKTFEPYLKGEGIALRHSCPYLHEQNGKVERKHRHIVETGLALLAQAKMPLKYWQEAFSHATYLINRLTSPTLENKTPFELLYLTKPDYSQIKVFGCECYPYLRPYNKHKFDFHTSKCILLGISISHKGYVCMHHSGRVYISASVKFNESSFPFQNDSNFCKYRLTDQNVSPTVLEKFQVVSFSTSVPSESAQQKSAHSQSQATAGNSEQLSNPVQDEACENLNLNNMSANQSPAQLPSNSTEENCNLPAITEPNTQASNTQKELPLHPMITRSKAGIFKPKVYQTSTQPETSLPQDSIVALKDPKWRRAMEDEYNALIKNQTWTLIPHDQNYKLIGNKWVYKVKENPYGTINRYKARLVVKGFLQTPGLDFNETFSPVVKAATIRIILTLAVNNDWMLRQVDINNAFLNGELTETVYMPQPEGFEDKRKPNHICKLKKALYGLRQAPRAWFDKLKSALYSWGFNNSKCDTSLFFRKNNAEMVIILVYVDDIIVTGSDNKGIEGVIGKLSEAFALKDLGNLSYFLGIQVIRNQNSILLSQAKYVQDLLTKTEMESCKGIESPFSTSEKLKKGEGAKLDNPSFYRSVIGSLQYAVLTRPELAYSVNKLSQYMSDPRQPHWIACKRVLRYLKNTGNMCLQFKKSEHLDLVAYTDADWASDPDDRRSISGYCVFLGDNLVAWSSRKQGMVARSTAESEYRAMALCTTEITWINSLFDELKIEMQRTPMILSDSTSAAAIATNPVYHSKTKHFEIDLHFIRDKVTQGELDINFVASRDQIADVLTKPLPYYKFSQFRSKLNVFDKTLSLREGVENSGCEEPAFDPKALLACHLSNHFQRAADEEGEVYPMSWQNCYGEEYQHVNSASWKFLECFQ